MAMKKTFSYPYTGSWSNADLLTVSGDWKLADQPSGRTKKNAIIAEYALVTVPPQCMITRVTILNPIWYCKGCGICVKECPRKAITMVPEV